MQTKTAKSISEAFDAARDIVASWSQGDIAYCWFRGANNHTLSLQPGACWRTDYRELDILVPFSQEGVTFANVGGLDAWDTYYLAQHHRIPTRLLDWTESFAASLFFAFDGWDSGGGAVPCIWVMRPEMLNQVTIAWQGIVSPENIPETEGWLPRKIAKTDHIVAVDENGIVYDNDRPLAIYPKKSNGRICAQQGMFTIHGRNSSSLPEIVTSLNADVDDVFRCIELVGFDDSVFQDLRMLGIRRSAIYPDIDNFVLDLKDYYCWEG